MNYKTQLNKDRLDLEIEKLDYFATLKGKIPKDNPLPYEDKLGDLWTLDFNKTFKNNLETLEKTGELAILWNIIYNANLQPEDIEPQLAGMIDRLDAPFSIQWAEQNREDVNELVDGIYVAGAIMALQASGVIDPIFTLHPLDTLAINQLNNMGIIYSSTATSTQIITPVAVNLAKEAIALGLNTEEAGILFSQGLKDLIPLKSSVYYQKLASVVISRARNYGRIMGFNRAGAVYIQWNSVMAPNTCATCASLHGTAFRVADLVTRIEENINVNTPEELVNHSPFSSSIKGGDFIMSNGTTLPTSASSTDIVGAGINIPAHPSCWCFWTRFEV